MKASTNWATVTFGILLPDLKSYVKYTTLPLHINRLFMVYTTFISDVNYIYCFFVMYVSWYGSGHSGCNQYNYLEKTNWRRGDLEAQTGFRETFKLASIFFNMLIVRNLKIKLCSLWASEYHILTNFDAHFDPKVSLVKCSECEETAAPDASMCPLSETEVTTGLPENAAKYAYMKESTGTA